MARHDNPPEVAALFPKLKPHVSYPVFFWCLIPAYVAILAVSVAYLSVLNGQAQRITKRDAQFCDIARLFVAIEPILPQSLQDIIDHYVKDIQKNGANCVPALVKPPLKPSPTPSASAEEPGKHHRHKPKPSKTVTVPGPTSYATVTASPRPTKHRRQHPRPPHPGPRKPGPPKSVSCTVQEALAGKCVIDIPDPPGLIVGTPSPPPNAR